MTFLRRAILSVIESSIIIVVEKLRMKEFTNRKVKVKKYEKKNLPHPTEHSILIPLLLNSIVETRPGPHVVAFCLKMVKNYVISC